MHRAHKALMLLTATSLQIFRPNKSMDDNFRHVSQVRWKRGPQEASSLACPLLVLLNRRTASAALEREALVTILG